MWRQMDAAQPALNGPGVFTQAQGAIKVVPKGRYPELCGVSEAYNNDTYRDRYDNILRLGHSPEDELLSFTQADLVALASWRATKLIYSFDTTFLHELAKTPLKDAPPTSIFDRLPADSFFLAIDAQAYPQDMAEWLEAQGMSEGVFVTKVGSRLSLDCVRSINLEFDLSDSLELESAIEDRISTLSKTYGVVSPDYDYSVDLDKMRRSHMTYWRTALNALLYLCIDEPDIDAIALPTPKRLRMGSANRTLEAKSETTLNVGQRIGALFDREPAQPKTNRGETPGSSGQSMPAHIRRAHWHTYWVGPRSNPEPTLKWVHATVVNARVDGGLDEVTHPVRRPTLKG